MLSKDAEGAAAGDGGEREGSKFLNERLNEETGVVVDALLSHAVETRGAVQNLTRRVANRAEAIAQELGLEVGEQKTIRKAAVLRDVGKAGVPDNILKKSGPLTAREFAEVRTRMVPEGDEEDTEPVRAAILIAHHHHERVDGEGYPDGLRGEAIPLGARILAVAEAYETMLAPAPWRPAREPAEALAEIQGAVGAQFDGEVVKALTKTVEGDSVKPADNSR